jgi:hypothetical protein
LRSSLGLLPKLGGVATTPPFFGLRFNSGFWHRCGFYRLGDGAMRVQDEKTTKLLPAALLAAMVALVGLAGAVKIARSTVDLGPRVGDIVRFDPRESLSLDDRAPVAAAQVNGAACAFDLDAAHHFGGSLVVEERFVLGGRTHYRVHWASRGGAGAGCGRVGDLVMDGTNLELLAMAAGGWGVSHLRSP